MTSILTHAKLRIIHINRFILKPLKNQEKVQTSLPRTIIILLSLCSFPRNDLSDYSFQTNRSLKYTIKTRALAYPNRTTLSLSLTLYLAFSRFVIHR